MNQYKYSEIFANKQNILFVTAHPDDVIVYYAALILMLVADKKNIYVVTVTNGGRGGNGDLSVEEVGSLRIAEELSALKSLGVDPNNCTCLGYLDGDAEASYKLIGEISKYIRMFRADIVCTHEPTMIYTPTYDKSGFFVQHRDHRKVAEAVVDACYPFSRGKSFFPEHLVEGIKPHEVTEILMTDEISSNFELDYTEDVEQKIKALEIHASQFPTRQDAEDLVAEVKSGDRYVEKYFYVKLLW